ncbi:ATP-binding protein [Desulfocurvus vexinensis]|uniref:ATP-binding protein n=1 Tax=Desulfocurvus vexinensis TaxID=399548 RepID=UPI0004B6983E|nr:ATP-binding protein [Desulfocurvus vexinensis]
MTLRLRVRLAGLALVAAIALATTAAAVLTIERLTQDLNHNLLDSELAAYVRQVAQAREVLVATGLSGVREYIERAKADLLAEFRAEAPTRFGQLTVLTLDGRPVLHDGPPGAPPLAPRCLEKMLAQGRGFQECVLHDQHRVGHFQTLPDWDWLLLVSVSTGEMYRTRNAFLLEAGTIFLAVSLLGWLVFVRLSRSVVDPVLRLSGAARAIGAGDWEQVPPPSGRADELGELERSFADMARSLRRAAGELEERAGSLHAANARLSAEVAERVRAEQELHRAHDAFGAILDSMPSIVIGVDHQCRVTHWNRTAAETTGVPAAQVVGQPVDQALPRLRHRLGDIRSAMDEGRPRRLDKQIFHQDGQARQEDILVFPLLQAGAVGAVIRLDDVTARVRMEEVMVQTEKMMSVGGLAAGMAHEMNNPLAGVLTGAQNLQRRLDPDLEVNRAALAEAQCPPAALAAYLRLRKVDKILESIREAGQRAAEIIRSMLEFSRGSAGSRRPVDLSRVLDRSVELAGNEYDLTKSYDFRKVVIVRDYASDVPPVPCVGSEIEQVLLNLLRNAAQAMAAADMGAKAPTLTLGLRREGGHAVIELGDNGPGIPEATRRRIFEPFFTTKPPGVGTGLGLSVSYFIITENHGGTIEVRSEPGQGTRFRIRLPLHPEPPAA